METNKKREAITKKVNEYTKNLSIGQTQKLGDAEVNHLYRVYLERDATEREVEMYRNHPDNVQLSKHLQMMRKDKEKGEKMVGESGMMGQGGPAGSFPNVMQNLSQFGGGSVANPNTRGTPNFI